MKNNALEIREVFKRVHGITRPKHTDVIKAIRIMHDRNVGPQIAVGYVLIANRGNR